MPNVTLFFGGLLTLLGLVGYFGGDPDQRSMTALIPAFVGGPILLCGLIAQSEKLRKHAMHVAAMLGLLGALAAGGRGASKLGTLTDPDAPKRATVFVLLMAAICLVYFMICLNSFLAARKARKAGEAEASERP